MHNAGRLADTSSQNLTVSEWFQYNREPLGQDIQLACLSHMDCREGHTKPKPALVKQSTPKEQLSCKAIVIITQPKLLRLFESQVDLYTNTES